MIDSFFEYKKNGLTILANWNEAVTPCKMFKFIIGGKEVIMSRDDLYTLLFLFANEEQMTDLIPVKDTELTMIRRLIKVKAQKNIKKGQFITFPYNYAIPKGEYEKLVFSDSSVKQIPENFKKLLTP